MRGPRDTPRQPRQAGSGSGSLPLPDAVSHGGKLGEAQAALGVLGYSPSEAACALKGVDCDAMTVEEVIRAALKNMVQL